MVNKYSCLLSGLHSRSHLAEPFIVVSEFEPRFLRYNNTFFENKYNFFWHLEILLIEDYAKSPALNWKCSSKNMMTPLLLQNKILPKIFFGLCKQLIMMDAPLFLALQFACIVRMQILLCSFHCFLSMQLVALNVITIAQLIYPIVICNSSVLFWILICFSCLVWFAIYNFSQFQNLQLRLSDSSGSEHGCGSW